MKLIELSTTNFKRLGTRTINLTSGLNAITGPNGFGKTTLIEAFLTALYGTSQVRGAAAALKTRDTTGAWKVAATFQAGKLFYKVSCSASTAELVSSETSDFKSPEVIAKGRSDVTAAVAALLGSAESFKFLHLVEQKEAFSIARSGGIRLQRQVEKQTGADVLIRVEDWCKAEFNRIDAIVNHRHSVVEHDLSGLKEKHKSMSLLLQSKLRDLEDVDVHAHLLEQRDQAAHDEKVARDQDAQWVALKQARESAAQAVESASYKVDLLMSQRSQVVMPDPVNLSLLDTLGQRVDEVSAKIRHAAEVERQIKAAEAELKVFERRKAEVEGKIDAYRKQSEADDEPIDDLRQAVESARAELKAAQDSWAKVQDDRDVAARQVKGLKKDLAALENQLHSTTCPTCHQSMPEVTPEYVEKVEGEIAAAKLKLELEQEKISHADDESQRLNQVVVEARSALTSVEGELSSSEARQHAKEQAKAELQGLEAVLEDLANSDLSDIPERIDTAPLYAEKEQISEELSYLRRQEEDRAKADARIKGLSDQIDVALADKKSAEGQLKSLPVLGDRPDVDYCQRRHQEFSKQAADFIARRDRAKFEVESAERELASLFEMINKVEQEKTEIDGLKSRKVSVAELAKYVKSRRSEYLGQVWGSICREASSVAKAITEGITSESGQSTEIDSFRRDGDTFVCTEDGHEVAIKELSGAQEDVAGIAIKIAVSKVLNPGSGFLMLDEPTSAMSSKIGTRCISVISSMNGQVVTVTHKEDEIRSAENVVELI